MSTTDTIVMNPVPPKPPKRHRVRNTMLIVSATGLAAIIGASVASSSGGTSAATSTPAASSQPWDSSTLHPTPPETAAPAAPAPTVAQQQALESAQSYLDMGGFSTAGLLDQLTSSAGEGFAMSDARWAGWR